MIEIEINRGEQPHVTVYYTPKHEKAICDVCDNYGRVVQTEENKNNRFRLNMAGLKEGLYNLFIMDGQVLIQKTIRVPVQW